MDGLMLRLNLVALLGLLIAAPVALVNLLAGYLPGACAWGLAATSCAVFLGAQLVISARLQMPSKGRHSNDRTHE